jgi:hypothetical protein
MGGQSLLDGGLVDNAPAFLPIRFRCQPAAGAAHQTLSRGIDRPEGKPLVPVPRRSRADLPLGIHQADLVEATIALGDREAVRREAELVEFLNGK